MPLPPTEPDTPGPADRSRRRRTRRRLPRRADVGRALRDPFLAGLLALTTIAALLRLLTLAEQSFWLDETFTALYAERDLAGLWEGITEGENTPPLYYLLAWGWAQVFGNGEVALRSLSALFGIATIPVAYAAGSELVSRRTGLIAAALAAVSPVLVWYSQEARAYALLILLSGLSLWLALRVQRRGEPRDVALWALASALALGTHYYAAFVVLPLAGWLLAVRRPRLPVALGAGAQVLVLAALAPLAVHQRGRGGASDVAAAPLLDRVERVPRAFLSGELGGGDLELVNGVGAALVAAALTLLALRGSRVLVRRAAVPAAVGVAGILLPLTLALAGFDYFTGRYLLAAWLPLMLVVATGLAVPRPAGVGAAIGAALFGLLAAVSIAVPSEPRLQREDWRAAAQRLEEAPGGRAIALAPEPGFVALFHYLEGGLTGLPPEGARVREVAVLSFSPERAARPSEPPPPPVPGLQEIERLNRPSFALVRYRAAAPMLVRPGDLARAVSQGDYTFLLQRGE